MKIEELHLSVRTYNALRRNNITDVEQLEAMSYEEMMAMKFFGVGAVKELEICMDTYVRGKPYEMTDAEVDATLALVVLESNIPSPQKKCLAEYLEKAAALMKEQNH